MVWDQGTPHRLVRTLAPPIGILTGWVHALRRAVAEFEVFSFKFEAGPHPYSYSYSARRAVLVLDPSQTPNPHTPTHRFEYE
jgi:hypothetical protein